MEHGLYKKPRFRIAGDRGLLVEYGDKIDPAINRKVRTMVILIDQEMPSGIIEVIPTYRSLLIVYDPANTNLPRIKEDLAALEQRQSQVEIPPPATVTIPVCYGGSFGPDLAFVADHNGLTAEEVINSHTASVYPIYMIGFTPGFPFLGGLPEKLHTPRLKTPRTKVPAGSVGIANNQTGVYPVASPGGWQLIGQTPLKLFDPSKKNPFLYQVGDLIKFEAISSAQFSDMAAREGNDASR
jgi:KipI family sensor histidine kinase inhibitor